MDKIEECIKCPICLDRCTLPVHLICCEATRTNPACLHCTRRYFSLNKRKNDFKKSFSTCNCMIDTSLPAHKIYRHTKELWSILDALGLSKCYHPECAIKFNTTAALKRHLDGNILETDKFSACPEATTKCKYCNFVGKRKIVNIQHYNKYHFRIICDCCGFKFKNNQIDLAERHLEAHYKQLKNYEKNIQILKSLEL